MVEISNHLRRQMEWKMAAVTRHWKVSLLTEVTSVQYHVNMHMGDKSDALLPYIGCWDVFKISKIYLF